MAVIYSVSVKVQSDFGPKQSLGRKGVGGGGEMSVKFKVTDQSLRLSFPCRKEEAQFRPDLFSVALSLKQHHQCQETISGFLLKVSSARCLVASMLSPRLDRVRGAESMGRFLSDLLVKPLFSSAVAEEVSMIR